MENLNIALIGCGMIGREHIERIQNRIRGAQVVAVCDVFEEGAKKGAEIAGAGTKVYTDFNEAINDPDVNAVVVTTPGQFHKGPVLAAIKAGKPVFSEKPLANTAADGKEIVEAEMAGGKHLVQVGFMRRYDRGYRQVKELIDSGKFGAPMVIKWHPPCRRRCRRLHHRNGCYRYRNPRDRRSAVAGKRRVGRGSVHHAEDQQQG